MKVVGIQRSQGEFEGYPYDNYVLFVTDADIKGLIAGICPRTIKVKATKMQEILDQLNMNKIDALMNKNIIPYYDAYKKVCKIELM